MLGGGRQTADVCASRPPESKAVRVCRQPEAAFHAEGAQGLGQPFAADRTGRVMTLGAFTEVGNQPDGTAAWQLRQNRESGR